MEIKIRKFKKEDARQVLVLNRALSAAHDSAAPITEKQLVSACLSSGLMTCFVAKIGEKIVGYIASYDWIDLAYGTRACFISQLYTHEKYRRRGFGVALMKRAAREAIKRGCFRMITKADKGNKSSNALYKRSGLFLRNNKSNRYVIQAESFYQFARA